MIFYGIDEDRSETEELVAKIKRNTFQEKLEVSISSIERCTDLVKKAKRLTRLLLSSQIIATRLPF